MPFLVAGPTGAGKTTIARALPAHGWSALDTDRGRLARWTDPDGHVVPDGEIRFADPDWTAAHRWHWDPERVEALLADPAGPRVWCGYAQNATRWAARFDAIVSLRVDVGTMLARVSDPARDNPWGRDPAMHPALVAAVAEVDGQLDACGAVPLDANRPFAEVLSDLLALLAE